MVNCNQKITPDFQWQEKFNITGNLIEIRNSRCEIERRWWSTNIPQKENWFLLLLMMFEPAPTEASGSFWRSCHWNWQHFALLSPSYSWRQIGKRRLSSSCCRLGLRTIEILSDSSELFFQLLEPLVHKKQRSLAIVCPLRFEETDRPVLESVKFKYLKIISTWLTNVRALSSHETFNPEQWTKIIDLLLCGLQFSNRLEMLALQH